MLEEFSSSRYDRGLNEDRRAGNEENEAASWCCGMVWCVCCSLQLSHSSFSLCFSLLFLSLCFRVVNNAWKQTFRRSNSHPKMCVSRSFTPASCRVHWTLFLLVRVGFPSLLFHFFHNQTFPSTPSLSLNIRTYPET